MEIATALTLPLGKFKLADRHPAKDTLKVNIYFSMGSAMSPKDRGMPEHHRACIMILVP